MKKNILLIAALLGAMVWTSCERAEAPIADDPESEEQVDTKTWAITVRAVKIDNPKTKGLDIEGDEATTTTLKSVWKTGETVKVYLGSECIGTLTAIPDGADAHNALLSGTITTSGITAGTTKLTFLTPRDEWSYNDQVGKLLLSDDASGSIEAKYHYTMAAEVLVISADTDGDGKGAIATETATFANQQSIYRLSFRYQTDPSTKTPITTKSVTITSANGHLVQSQDVTGTTVTEGPVSVKLGTATTDPFFVALRNGDQTNEEVFTFTVVDNDGVTYKGTKTIPAQYKPNGTFLSVKNATLTNRLEAKISTTETSEAW